MAENEWVAVWMLRIVKKRERLDIFIYKALRDVVKLSGDNVIQNFEEQFKELRSKDTKRKMVYPLWLCIRKMTKRWKKTSMMILRTLTLRLRKEKHCSWEQKVKQGGDSIEMVLIVQELFSRLQIWWIQQKTLPVCWIKDRQKLCLITVKSKDRGTIFTIFFLVYWM